MSMKEKIELYFAVPFYTPLTKFWKRNFNTEVFKIDIRHCFDEYLDKDIIITRSTKHFIEVQSKDGRQRRVYEKKDYERNED